MNTPFKAFAMVSHLQIEAVNRLKRNLPESDGKGIKSKEKEAREGEKKSEK